MEYFISAFKRYADFTGRARRKEYWMFMLFYILIYVVLSVVDAVLGSAVLAFIFSLIAVTPSIAIAARRLHDTGRSGWWQLIGFIPLIGALVLIYFLVQDSQDDNQYGPNPKKDDAPLSDSAA